MRLIASLTAGLIPALLLAISCPAQPLVVPDGQAYTGKKIIATTCNSGFALGHDSYNGMGTGSDGRITMCSARRTWTRARDVLL